MALPAAANGTPDGFSGIPQNPDIPLNSTTVACVAIMRLAEMTPESAWEAMDYDTRRLWLRLDTVSAQGLAVNAWRSLPPGIQKRLRLTVAGIQLFLASVGADLLA